MAQSALRLQPSVFLLHAQSIMSISALKSTKMRRGSRETTLNRFRALFGVTPMACAIIWNRLLTVIPEGGSSNQLLWALLFMKVYATEHVNRGLTGADEKILRKWIWTFVELISNLSVIHWDDRMGIKGDVQFRVSVDGTDFRICEPTPFSPRWYSHKFHGPGLRYEVGICIRTGKIVWAHGPFPCRSYSHVRIFRLGMKRNFDE